MIPNNALSKIALALAFLISPHYSFAMGPEGESLENEVNRLCFSAITSIPVLSMHHSVAFYTEQGRPTTRSTGTVIHSQFRDGLSSEVAIGGHSFSPPGLEKGAVSFHAKESGKDSI